MIAVIDYGVGNLFSLSSSLSYLGLENEITRDPARLEAADRIILPGVGAFADAMRKLEETGLVPVLKQQVQKKPLLGICLGMQLLFDKSYEYGEHAGLGLIPGQVCPLEDDLKNKALKVPHIGWNALHFPADKPRHKLLETVQDNECVYFVHSFYATDCNDAVIATTEYGAELTAAVARGNVMGCQFHPEKSGDVGLAILKTFCEGSW